MTVHLPACHPSCLSCSGPSQADCVSCPPLASLQDGYCRTTCHDGRFLHAASGECRGKLARSSACARGWTLSCTFVRHLRFIRATSVGCFALERPQREQNPQLLQRQCLALPADIKGHNFHSVAQISYIIHVNWQLSSWNRWSHSAAFSV